MQGFVSSPSAKVTRSGADGDQLPGTALQQNCEFAEIGQEIEHIPASLGSLCPSLPTKESNVV